MPQRTRSKSAERSRGQRFVAASGNLGDTAKLPYPVRIVAEMIQYLIALMLLAFAKAIQHTFQKAKQPKHGSAPDAKTKAT